VKRRQRKLLPLVNVRLKRLIGGGQTLGTLADGKKLFVWGGLPNEQVEVQLTKSKSNYAEGVVTEVVQASPQRVEPRDPESYLSTSPWQIMDFDDEQTAKAQLVHEAFELHHVVLPKTPEIYSDGRQYEYRNKVEFSWWWDNDTSGAGQLDLAFYKRGSHGKQPVNGTSLARPEINRLALAVRDLLRQKQIEARSLKTLLIRCNGRGDVVWQLYVKDQLPTLITEAEATALPAAGGEVIYSDPRSPASRITERLQAFGNIVLTDELLGRPFSYATEGFFQVNLPVYERALCDMQAWLGERPTLDMYSGVGSVGLSIGRAYNGTPLTLVEVDEHAYREMERNIAAQQRTDVQAVLAPSEKALDTITQDVDVIVDPPRAGLHQAVVDRLLEVLPARIIYLSCNPVTQARDVSLLLEQYEMVYTRGYNFFPRTPHIEHLVVLQKRG